MFGILALISLVLWAAMIAAWIAGGIHPRTLRWHARGQHYFFATFDRWILVLAEQYIFEPPLNTSIQADASKLGRLTVSARGGRITGQITFEPVELTKISRLGFGSSTMAPAIEISDNNGKTWRIRNRIAVCIFPCWPLIILFSILPALAWRSRRRRFARQSTGLCRNCGYDLRATPQRCPECGTLSLVGVRKSQGPGHAEGSPP